ncbi:sulfate ABC transporter permease subunit CysT [Paenibacillus sp. GCM10012307]|uniref:Sulfate transport system permease protein CysT n=1 Tax=Paenibacillus roseus TaxID=2798579 RepID=A0A934J8P1_9BACL|nr:sulfate ABC transporter permease subunit CysT [Paenibacillus roseus]MBJ6362467.1 sulfate ABC transporter permease subunit CysT [Paenibacillus roseus]
MSTTSLFLYNPGYKLLLDRFTHSFLNARRKKYHKFFSKEGIDDILGYLFDEKRVTLFLFSHLSFFLFLPLYAIFSYVAKSPWEIVIEKATNDVALAAISLSFRLALLVAIINTSIGYIIVWCLVRFDFPLKKILDAAVDFPFTMPTAVAGLTLTTLFGPKGIGRFLSKESQIIYTVRGVFLAMLFTTAPFVARSVQPILLRVTLDLETEENAWCLGTDEQETFKKILFPITFPALLNGFTLTFSRALGEYGSVVMVSGNFPFEDLVSSVYVSQTLEQYDYIGACTISSMVILGACIFLFIMYTLRYYYHVRKIRKH